MIYAVPSHGGFSPIPSDPGTPGTSQRPVPGRILLAGLGRQASSMAEALASNRHEARILEDFDAAVAEFSRFRPDTLVAGSADGTETTLALLEAASDHGVRVILALIDSARPGHVDDALAAGAHDVVAPPHSARAVLLRRRVLLQASVVDGSSANLNHQVDLGPLRIDLTARQVLNGAEPLTLSGREFELLIRLMEAQGEVVTRGRLLADIWGEGHGSEAVLDATVHRLRRKLDEKLDDEELIATVRGVGYRLRAARRARRATVV